MRILGTGLTWVFAGLVLGGAGADDPVFSGPQTGEKLAPFLMRGVYDPRAGQEIDLIQEFDGKPTLLVFVHEATRPSIAMTRLLMVDAGRRAERGLKAGVVWLAEDLTDAEAFLLRARHAMPTDVPVGISIDGLEGPGAYGLNRKVTLTVLLARENVVIANFPLVQPSLEVDGPKILTAVHELVGGGIPSLEELGAPMKSPDRPPAQTASENDPELATKLRALIHKTAAPEQVDEAAREVEEYVALHPDARRQLGLIVNRIVDSGRLEFYGTPRARDHLKRWRKSLVEAPRETPSD